MAYTSVIPVRRLDRTVDYVQNKAKTTPKSLEEAVDYAANRDKTESAKLFHQQAHHHRKVDEPNLFISKIHDLIANNTLGG